MLLISIIKGLGKCFTAVVLFFAISGVYFLVKPEKEVEEVPVVESFYPFEFRALQQDGKGPTLYVTVKNGYLDISPLVKSSFDYELGRLVYFDDETEPCGFEMTLTNSDGKQQKVLFHRGRPKFHTNWKYKIHYSNESDMETVKEIVKSAKQNIFCFESAAI